MNICVKCKFCTRKEPNSPRGECDYNISCAAFDDDMVPCQDPVLGVPGFSRTNDLGGFIFCHNKEDARPSCRSVNPHGECERFKAGTPRIIKEKNRR